MKGRKILITGGGGRLGSAIGKECLSQGAKVILVDNNEGALKKVIEECKELDSEGRLETFVGNSCSEKGIIDIMNYVKDSFNNRWREIT